MHRRNKNKEEHKVLYCIGLNEKQEQGRDRLSRIIQVNLNSINVVNGFDDSLKSGLFDHFLNN